MDYIEFNLVSIDATHDGYGWAWNQYYMLESCIMLAESELTPRRITRFLRKAGYLSKQSAGKIRVDITDDIIEILIKNNRPLLALSTIH